jgi:phytoene dehydrogenase-like protein
MKWLQRSSCPDATVVGAGPNGLVAALTLARAGLSVDVYEAAAEPGGGCRTADLTLPGFRHDVCSAVHPLLLASPAFHEIDLSKHGVRLLNPEVAFAHPLEGGRGTGVGGTIADVAASLGVDGSAYTRAFSTLVRDLDKVLPVFLGTMRSMPQHPVAAGGFGIRALSSSRAMAGRFRTAEARALIAGTAAHSMLPLTAPLSGAFPRLFVPLAHRYGWPVVEGGTAAIINALVAEFTSLGGRIETDCFVKKLSDLPPTPTVVLDVTPRQLLELAEDRLPPGYARALSRYRYGPGVCKVDWALEGPVPWATAASRQAVTVHVGGTFEDIAASEADVNAGRHPERPYCLVAQPCLVDPTRAPEGRQTLWAYCHVPNGSDVDMTDRIEAQIERFAPGFRDLILARSTFTAAATEEHNPSYVGGDINAGAATLRQMLFRPTVRWNPYRTALRGVYLCSAATPPGGGVHGMCGLGAARTALHDIRRSGASAPS